MSRHPTVARLAVLLCAFASGLLLLWAGLALAQEGDRPLLGDADLPYAIRQGDTLDGLGAFYDVDVACLYSVNNLPRTAMLMIGDQIMISPACPPYAGGSLVVHPRVVDVVEPNGDRLIVIRPGDTLDVLAQTHNISIDVLLSANNLTLTSLLRPGDRLRIPASAPPYGFTLPLTGDWNALAQGAGGGAAAYIVQYGDTLDEVAAYFDIQLACLLSTSGLNASSFIQPGTVLTLSADCPPYDGLTTASARDLHGLDALPTPPAAALNTEAQAAAPGDTALLAPTAISLPPLEGNLIPLDMTPLPEVLALATPAAGGT